MDRFRSVEVLLRVLAFSENRSAYDGNLARFLNEYMHAHTNDEQKTLNKYQEQLEMVTRGAKLVLSEETERKLPLLLVEALLVAMYSRGDQLKNYSDEVLKKSYLNMRSQSAFSESARYAVTSTENVKVRLEAAVKAFTE